MLNIQWRSDIIRYFQRGEGERIPVMMMGLKRDLRKEEEGAIYPQEVCACLSSLLLAPVTWLTVSIDIDV